MSPPLWPRNIGEPLAGPSFWHHRLFSSFSVDRSASNRADPPLLHGIPRPSPQQNPQDHIGRSRFPCPLGEYCLFCALGPRAPCLWLGPLSVAVGPQARLSARDTVGGGSRSEVVAELGCLLHPHATAVGKPLHISPSRRFQGLLEGGLRV